MNQTAMIFTQVIDRPARKLILRRSKRADNYFAYAEEFGCDNISVAWEVMSGIKEALGEPVGLWLPDNMRPAETGSYAHGVEVPADYSSRVPEGFDVIDLAPCKFIVFQGEPYNDANFMTAIDAVWSGIEKFNPEVYGYQYAPEMAPRMQLAPQGWRGYIELRPVRMA